MNLKFSKTDCLINWILVICHLSFISVGIVFKLFHWELWQPFLFVGVLSMITSWTVIFIEILRNRFSNRFIWILSMFVLPSVSPVVYLMRREKIHGFSEEKPEDYTTLRSLMYE
jgi:predicted membrane channel-forming protein YqfA (hemolysin III family)